MSSENINDTEYPLFRNLGESALLVGVGDVVSPEINSHVRGLITEIQQREWPGIREMVPSYTSLVIHFDPLSLSIRAIENLICEVWESALLVEEESGKIVSIPTFYGGDFGPDIEEVSDLTGLSVKEVIQRHSGVNYLVYALGFSPGFPYLGGLDESLKCARLSSPRLIVPAGSVAIADSQTGIYPVASPGGWRIIGRTPVKIFDHERNSPSIIDPGDFINFEPVYDEETFIDIQDRITQGIFEVEVTPS